MTNMSAATAVRDGGDWRRHLIEDTAGIQRVLEGTHRIAVLGIKIEESGAPAYYVPEYAQHAGF